MAVNVREERIELTTVDKGSEAVVRKVQSAYRELAGSIHTVQGAMAALGVTVSAGAMLAMHAQIIKATAALDDMSEATGSSVETLSKLQTISKVGGHDFDGLTTQIGKMIKGLKSADEDGQKAAKALEFLGVQARAANGEWRDQGEVLIDVAKKLNGYRDGAGKVALVQDALGKGAERYLPLLKDIAEEGDIAAKVTAKQAAEAEHLEKNINRLNIVFEDARRALALSFTPALVDLSERLLQAQKSGDLFFQVMIEGLRGYMTVAKEFPTWLPGVGAISNASRMALPALEEWELNRRRDRMGPYDPKTWRINQGTTIADWEEPSPKSNLRYSSPPTKKGDDPYKGLLTGLENELAKTQGLSRAQEVLLLLQQKRFSYVTQAERAEAIALASKIDLLKQEEEVRKALMTAAEERARRNDTFIRTREGFGNAGLNQELDLRHEMGWMDKTAQLERLRSGLGVHSTQQEIAEVGRLAGEIEKANAARQIELELRQAIAAIPDITIEEREALREDAERRKQNVGALIEEKNARQAILDAHRRQAEETRRMRDQLESSLTQGVVDGLMRGFERGESIFKNFWNTLKRTFATTVLTAMIQPIMRPVANFAAGAVQGLGSAIFGGGGGLGSILTPGGGIGGGLINASSLPGMGSMFGGGQLMADFGNFFGNIGATTEMGGTFGLFDAIGGFAAANPLATAGIVIGGLMLGSSLFGGGSDALQEEIVGRNHPAVDQNRLASDPIYQRAVKELEDEHLRTFGVPWTMPNANGDGTPTDSLRAGIEQRYQQYARIEQEKIDTMNAQLATEQQILAAMLGLSTSISQRLGIPTLENALSELAVSEYQSPLDRVAAARQQLEQGYARARGGDLAAVQAFPEQLQTALSIGRDVYASGPQFQELFTSGNRMLNDLLETQRGLEADVMRQLAVTVMDSGQNTVSAILSQTETLAEGLEQVRTEIKRLRQAA